MSESGSKVYILFFVLLLGASVFYGWRKDFPARDELRRERAQEIAALEEELRTLEEEMAQRKGRVADLEQDPLEIEASIRRWKRLVREGEIVYHIQGSEAGGASLAP